MFASLTGTYEVSGFDPLGNVNYTGTVVITKADDVYTAFWSFSDGLTNVGTGVQKDDSLSFVFSDGSSAVENTGVQLYEIGRRSLKGPFVRFGATSSGYEKIKKIHHHHHS